MDLILWRHAEAESPPRWSDDLRARADPQGRTPGAAHGRVAEPPHLAHSTRVLVSPALRCQQTAGAGRISRRCRARRPRRRPRLLSLARWPSPTSRCWSSATSPRWAGVRACCCGEVDQAWHIKKGAVWWMRSREREGGARWSCRQCSRPTAFERLARRGVRPSAEGAARRCAATRPLLRAAETAVRGWSGGPAGRRTTARPRLPLRCRRSASGVDLAARVALDHAPGAGTAAARRSRRARARFVSCASRRAAPSTRSPKRRSWL
jgi:phosphohistidine phosphatase